MGGEFRFHDVTTLPAELWCFHVLNRPVCPLCPNDDISGGSHREKNCEFPNVRAPVRTFQHPFRGRFNPPPRKENPQGDQYKAEDENNRDNNKNNNADVRIVGVPSKFNGQNEQPGEPAVVTRATPSMLIQWLVRTTSMGRFG